MANEFLFGLAIGNARSANNANEAAYTAATAANTAGKHLFEAVAIIGKLKDEVATLQQQVQIDKATINGWNVQIGAPGFMYPNSSLF